MCAASTRSAVEGPCGTATRFAGLPLLTASTYERNILACASSGAMTANTGSKSLLKLRLHRSPRQAENSADFYYFHFNSNFDAVAFDLVCLEAPQKTHHTDSSNPSLQDDRGTRCSHVNRKSFFARRLLPPPSLPPRFGTTPLPAHDRARTQSSRKEFRVAIPKLLLAGLRSLLIDSGRSEPKWRRLSQTGYGCNVARK